MTTKRLSTFAFRLLLMAVALALIAGAAFLAAQRADRQLRADLLLQTRMLAQVVNLEDIQALASTEADLDNPAYLELKHQFSAIRLANPKCRFVYLMGRKAAGTVYFFVDSEPAGSKDYSPPGQTYEEATEALCRVFTDKTAMVEGPVADRWGIWVSALIPLTDPRDDSVAAVLGMDIDAKDWKWTLAERTALPVALTAVAIMLGLLAATLYRSRRDLRAQQEILRKIEAQKNTILNGIPINIALVDKNLNILWANQTAADSVRRRAADMVGHPCYFFWGDPAQPCENCPTLTAFRTGKSEHRIIQTPDGRIWDESGEPIFDATGTVIFVVEIAHDITHRKQTEVALFESEKKLSTLFESTSEMTVLHELVFDEQGKAVNYRLTDCNQAFTQTTGIQKEQAIGKLATEVYRTETAPYLEEYARVGSTGNPLRFETFYAPMDKYFMISAVALGENKFATIANEITERKRTEEQVRALLAESNQARLALLGIIEDEAQAQREKAQLEADLHQAQKMESVGRLAGGVAHDFNNMLGVILGRAEMALEQVAPTQPVHADLKEIHGAALRAADITRQLLTFARKQPVAPKILDLNQAVEGTLQMLQRLIGENISLHWKRKAQLWPVKVDPSQIDQILVNLCVNARDAIAGVGKIAIEAGNATFDADYCADHAGFALGEFAWLAISDNGRGMDRETLDHIFEPFFTTKGVGEGTGLGLATVYGIVQQNNGFIHAYSEPGQGTLFKIYLPRHVDLGAPAEKDVPVVPAARGHETLLLVEDDPSILGMTQHMIERQGYTVWAANTPDEAIRLAKERIGEIHLLITDVVMPEMNGRDLAKTLLTFYPDLKLLFMSGYTADIIAHNGVLDDGVNFIQKPFSRQDLSAKIREVLDSGKA